MSLEETLWGDELPIPFSLEDYLEPESFGWFCPSCGTPFMSELELVQHNWIACWNATRECPECKEKQGFDWESDPLFKICNACGYRWSKL